MVKFVKQYFSTKVGEVLNLSHLVEDILIKQGFCDAIEAKAEAVSDPEGGKKIVIKRQKKEKK